MEFNLPQILSYAQIRGYSPRLANAVNTLISTRDNIEYKEALKEATQEITGFSDFSLLTGDDTDSVSDFNGLPIYMPLIFESTENIKTELVLESAIVSVNRAKNIVITEVQGRDSTIKEFINNGDFQISVTGLLCNSDAKFPKAKIKSFHRFLEAKQSIAIVHDVLNALGIYEFVITDYDLPNTPMYNAQAYSFNAISETSLELRISQS